jgi:hypothetical protein
LPGWKEGTAKLPHLGGHAENLSHQVALLLKKR